MELVCGSLWIPFLCRKLEFVPTPTAQSIVCTQEGKFVAGALFDHYNGAIVGAHIVVEGRPCKEWYVCIFDYPFHVLQVTKIIGQVSSLNKKALRLDKNLGFVEEARIRNFLPSGADMVYLTMRPDQCRIFNDPLWAKVVQKVVRNGRNK